MGSLKSFALAGLVAAAAVTQASAADLLPPAPAFAPPPPVHVAEFGGWYLRGDIGIGSQEIGKVEGADVVRDGGSFWRKSLDDTAFVGIGVGYQVNSFLRFDLTGEYRMSATYDTSDKFRYTRFFGPQEIDTHLTNRYKGDLQTSVFLANAYVDLGTWAGITPFIGAGAGFAHHRMRNNFDSGLIYNYDALTGTPVNTESTGGVAGDANRTNFAWALHAGLAYDVSQTLKLELAYRYLNMGQAHTGVLNCGVTCVSGQTFSPLKLKTIESHDLKLGMRWLLGAPVPVVAEAPPPIIERPLVRKY